MHNFISIYLFKCHHIFIARYTRLAFQASSQQHNIIE